MCTKCEWWASSENYCPINRLGANYVINTWPGKDFPCWFHPLKHAHITSPFRVQTLCNSETTVFQCGLANAQTIFTTENHIFNSWDIGGNNKLLSDHLQLDKERVRAMLYGEYIDLQKYATICVISRNVDHCIQAAMILLAVFFGIHVLPSCLFTNSLPVRNQQKVRSFRLCQVNKLLLKQFNLNGI